ncbi:MAG TPA: hypothetical protein G4O04_08725 [Anaerolineae bacterium]|nr:hypothetical protein [Anaerolineae bacterium]
MATLPITQTASPFHFLTLDEAALETGYSQEELLKVLKPVEFWRVCSMAR